MLLMLLLPQPPVTCCNFYLDQRAFSSLCLAALALQALLARERIQPALCLDLGCLGCGETLGSSSLLPFEEIRPLVSFQSGVCVWGGGS